MKDRQIYFCLAGLLIPLYSLAVLTTGAIPTTIERNKNKNLSRSKIEQKVKETHPLGNAGYHIIAKPGVMLSYLLNPEK